MGAEKNSALRVTSRLIQERDERGPDHTITEKEIKQTPRQELAKA